MGWLTNSLPRGIYLSQKCDIDNKMRKQLSKIKIVKQQIDQATKYRKDMMNFSVNQYRQQQLANMNAQLSDTSNPIVSDYQNNPQDADAIRAYQDLKNQLTIQTNQSIEMYKTSLENQEEFVTMQAQIETLEQEQSSMEEEKDKLESWKAFYEKAIETMKSDSKDLDAIIPKASGG